tara:strand:+ start:1634 stop:1879 length:246 start_codon:yes stop_codon:yes gene_type:complete
MKYFIKSKRKHGNPEDFRWYRGYPDQPVMGVVDESHVKTKVDAFNDFAEWYEISQDVDLPIKDFDIHIVKDDDHLDFLRYD